MLLPSSDHIADSLIPPPPDVELRPYADRYWFVQAPTIIFKLLIAVCAVHVFGSMALVLFASEYAVNSALKNASGT